MGLLVGVVGLALVPPPAVAGDDDDDERVLPGDGVEGPPLRYQVNRNGTISDRNTRLIWEMKLADTDAACTDPDQTNRSVHCVNNSYRWSDTDIASDGSLFDDFLARLNNRCERDDTIPYARDRDCRAVGGKCGFAGKRDWRIPHVKELQSIVDYGTFSPAIDPAFDPTATGSSVTRSYWSSTSFAAAPAALSTDAWLVDFHLGTVFPRVKFATFRARAVRGGCD